MTRDDIFAQIKTALVDLFEVDEEAITPEARLYQDLELDSIDAIDLVVHLQKLTGKKIKPSTGQRVELNTPENQSVKNHNTARSNLGNISAITANKQGMADSFWF